MVMIWIIWGGGEGSICCCYERCRLQPRFCNLLLPAHAASSSACCLQLCSSNLLQCTLLAAPVGGAASSLAESY